MDAGIRTPLIEAFRRSDVPREVRLDAAQGQVAPRGVEQLALLMLLADDDDDEVRGAADRTLEALPPETVALTLGRSEVTAEMVRFFAGRGIVPQASSAEIDAPVVDGGAGTAWDADRGGAGRSGDGRRRRAVGHPADPADDRHAAGAGGDEGLARDAGDPGARSEQAGGVGGAEQSRSCRSGRSKAFAKMANVTEDVLRSIAQNRAWAKNYGVALGLTRNPKTPVALSLTLLHRLVERDVKAIAADRNVPEPLRLAARKKLVATQSR